MGESRGVFGREHPILGDDELDLGGMAGHVRADLGENVGGVLGVDQAHVALRDRLVRQHGLGARTAIAAVQPRSG